MIVQFGGQTPLNLALRLKAAGVHILGTSPESIDLAEDRKSFGKLLEDLNIPQPPGAMASSVEEALAYPYTERDRAAIARNRSRLFVGSPATVMQMLEPMIAASQADELMVITAIFDHEARKRSYSLLADAFGLKKKAAA